MAGETDHLRELAIHSPLITELSRAKQEGCKCVRGIPVAVIWPPRHPHTEHHRTFTERVDARTGTGSACSIDLENPSLCFIVLLHVFHQICGWGLGTAKWAGGSAARGDPTKNGQVDGLQAAFQPPSPHSKGVGGGWRSRGPTTYNPPGKRYILRSRAIRITVGRVAFEFSFKQSTQPIQRDESLRPCLSKH